MTIRIVTNLLQIRTCKYIRRAYKNISKALYYLRLDRVRSVL